MKLTSGLLLSIVILFSNFSNAIIYITFKINQKEIVSNLCIKRNNTINTCNGKCYLAKQLKKAAEKEKKETQSIKEKQDTLYFQEIIKFVLNETLVTITNEKVSFICNGLPRSIINLVFRPPLK